MKTKKSFTLVEILVTITCATIVLAALVSSVVFVGKMNKNAINESSTSYKIAHIEDFIRNKSNELDENSSDRFVYDSNEDKLYYNDGVESTLIFDKMEYISIEFLKETKSDGLNSHDYLVVYIKYNENDIRKVISFTLKRIA